MKVSELLSILENADPDLDVEVAPIVGYPDMSDEGKETKIADPFQRSPVVQVVQHTEYETPERKSSILLGFALKPDRADGEAAESVH